jgi:geranylgeranyl diphosphate synthase type I
VAFQLRDDWLSVFGDPARTGKPFASDLKAGKRTALMAAGLRRARGKDRRALRAVFGNPLASDAELARAVTALETSGAERAVQARIVELVASAQRALKSTAITREGRELLAGALQSLTARGR